MLTWGRFTRWVLAATAGLGATLYGFILIMDPYQNVPFSPALARAPVSGNQRFAYPALARSAAFDSAVLGTSTVRLLDPERLGAALGARFVNLAMNSATAYEQGRIHALFARHHPEARYVVVGMDEVWCDRAVSAERYTFRAFPEWMYDDNPWNDLVYLFNDKALENAVRMAELLAGRREPKYRRDGYADFTADFGPYDARASAARLHRGRSRGPRDVDLAPRDGPPEWRFVQLGRLRRMVAETSPTARWVLVFPPLHARYLASVADTLAACKAQVERGFAAAGNVAVLDYMYVSPLTSADTNYWDPLHYRNAVARLVERDIAAVAAGHAPPSAFARVLSTSAGTPAR